MRTRNEKEKEKGQGFPLCLFHPSHPHLESTLAMHLKKKKVADPTWLFVQHPPLLLLPPSHAFMHFRPCLPFTHHVTMQPWVIPPCLHAALCLNSSYKAEYLFLFAPTCALSVSGLTWVSPSCLLDMGLKLFLPPPLSLSFPSYSSSSPLLHSHLV